MMNGKRKQMWHAADLASALGAEASGRKRTVSFFFHLALGFLSIVPLGAADRVQLTGHVPAGLAQLQQIEQVSPSQQMTLAIGLPLRNRPALTNLLREIYNPASPQYRHFLTPQQFTEMFAPTEKDYQ